MDQPHYMIDDDLPDSVPMTEDEIDARQTAYVAARRAIYEQWGLRYGDEHEAAFALHRGDV